MSSPDISDMDGRQILTCIKGALAGICDLSDFECCGAAGSLVVKSVEPVSKRSLVRISEPTR